MGSKTKIGPYALLAKLGPKLFAIATKLLKGAKVAKVGLAVGSAAAYSYLYTWQFAATLMAALFVHESGHIWAMRKCGMRVKGMYFIPFVGAAAVTDESFKSRWSESFVALAGPVWGAALAAGCAVAYGMTNNPFWAAIAGWMAMVNLFNLLPVNPLDGGRVFKSVAFSVGTKWGKAFIVIGTLLAAYVAMKLNSFIFAFLAVVGLLEIVLDLFPRKKPEAEEGGGEHEEKTVPTMKPVEMAASVIAYFALAGVLFWILSSMSHVPDADIARQVLIDD